MITKINLKSQFSAVTLYKVVRQTVWAIAEKENLLLFIGDGACSFDANGETYNLQKGDFLFLPAGTEYLRKPLNDLPYTVYYAHFLADATTVSLANAQKQLIELSAKPNADDGELYLNTVANANDYYDLIVSVLDRAISIREKEEVKNDLQLNIAFKFLLSITAEKSQEKIIKGLKAEKLETFPDALKDAVFYIKTHLNEKITLQDLCNVAIVSPQQLIRYFKKYTGKTPNEYVTDYKLNVARDYIMRSKELSIKTIAYELGYDDQCYFSRVFSKCTGETPTEYYLRVKNFHNSGDKAKK